MGFALSRPYKWVCDEFLQYSIEVAKIFHVEPCEEVKICWFRVWHKCWRNSQLWAVKSPIAFWRHTRRDAPTPSHRGAGKSENASFVSLQEMKFTQLRASCCPGQSYRSNKWRRKPCNTSREPIDFVGNLVLSTSWILTFRGSKWCRRIFNELVSGQALWRDAVLTWSLWVCPWLSVQSHCHGPSMTGRPTKAKVYPVSCEAWLYFGPGN